MKSLCLATLGLLSLASLAQAQVVVQQSGGFLGRSRQQVVVGGGGGAVVAQQRGGLFGGRSQVVVGGGVDYGYGGASFVRQRTFAAPAYGYHQHAVALAPAYYQQRVHATFAAPVYQSYERQVVRQRSYAYAAPPVAAQLPYVPPAFAAPAPCAQRSYAPAPCGSCQGGIALAPAPALCAGGCASASSAMLSRFGVAGY